MFSLQYVSYVASPGHRHVTVTEVCHVHVQSVPVAGVHSSVHKELLTVQPLMRLFRYYAHIVGRLGRRLC